MNQYKCIICGKEYMAYKSTNKVTCSKECQKEYARRRMLGKKRGDNIRKAISHARKGIDMTELQKKATESAKKSPKSGKFETNVNAIDWCLISPEGKKYEFHSLMNWLRENGKELFGCEPDTKEFKAVQCGICNAKRAMLGKTNLPCTYKGWRVIPTEKDEYDEKIRIRLE